MASMEQVAPDKLGEQQAEFWATQAPSVDGMLGGFGHISDCDVRGSAEFVNKIMDEKQRASGRAIDCGAGIGRCTKDLLLPLGFAEVDLMDISQKFLDESVAFVNNERLGKRFCAGLADFDFDIATERRWKLIWVQWCAIYLTDRQFIEFFDRAANALADDTSVIVLKENVLRGDEPAVEDKEDHSVTRSDVHLKKLWEEAGLEIILEERQTDFPPELFPVHMYALRRKHNA